MQYPGIKQVSIFQHLVVEIILRVQAQRTCLDAHIDVFTDQYDGALGLLVVQVHHYAEDGVVSFAIGKIFGEFLIDKLGLQKQPPGSGFVGLSLQGNALLNGLRVRADQLIQKATGLTGVTRNLGHAFLVVIQLFQHEHG